MPPTEEEKQKALVDVAVGQLAELLFMSYLEQKGLDPKKYHLLSPGPESPEAEHRASEHTDDPSEDPEAVE